MTRALFAADLHLGTDTAERTHLAVSFLEMALRQKADVYILGDLFDFWANNRILLKKFSSIFRTLQRLTSSGIKAHLLIGNRDFLLTPQLLQGFGITHLGEEAEIRLDSKRVLLAHGHTLCLSDTHFLRYKKRMWPVFILLDRFLPGPLENYIAKKLIIKSRHTIQMQDQSCFQFSADLIRRHFAAGIDTIICGHAHRKELQRCGESSFYALPSWEDARGSYLLYHNGEFSFHEYTARGESRSGP